MTVLLDGQVLPSSIEAWNLRYKFYLSFIRSLLSTNFSTPTHSALESLEFDVHFLVMDSQVFQYFMLYHSCANESQRRIVYLDSLLDSTEKSERTNCLIPRAVTEVRLLSVKAVPFTP